MGSFLAKCFLKILPPPPLTVPSALLLAPRVLRGSQSPLSVSPLPPHDEELSLFTDEFPFSLRNQEFQSDRLSSLHLPGKRCF